MAFLTTLPPQTAPLWRCDAPPVPLVANGHQAYQDRPAIGPEHMARRGGVPPSVPSPTPKLAA